MLVVLSGLPGAGKSAIADEVGRRRTICWPNGVDLDPDALHGDFEPATGTAPKLLRGHHLRPIG